MPLDTLSDADYRILRALCPPTALLQAMRVEPTRHGRFTLTLLVPRGQMARLADQHPHGGTPEQALFLRQEARHADARTDSEARRVQSVLERQGATAVRVVPSHSPTAPRIECTCTAQQLAAARRLLGPTLDRMTEGRLLPVAE